MPEPHMALNFRIAQTPEEACAAWGLVYEAYHRLGLIEMNPHRLHAVPQVLTHEMVVVLGLNQGDPASTLSAYLDGPEGLPLDAVYPAPLADLRQEGRQLMEVGLLADRRAGFHRTRDSLLELMRHTTYFGLTHGATDAVIGVHPRHVPFYHHLLGFETLGPARRYPGLNQAEVVPLRLNREWIFQQPPRSRGLARYAANPLPADAFAHRLRWTQSVQPPARLLRFLASQSPSAAA